MMKTLQLFVCVLLSTALAGPVVAADMLATTVLHYQEREPGTGSYPVRILINTQYLRMDDGKDASDFVLLDRARKTLFNVTHEARNILVIHDSSIPAPQGAPPFKTIVQADPDAPRIAGRGVKRVNVVAGKTICLSASVVPGLLPDVVAALAEYEHILEARQYRDMDRTPKEYRTPCFMANYVYAGGRHLQEGLPVQLSLHQGRQRMLVDYHEAQPMPTALFSLPSEYKRIDMK